MYSFCCSNKNYKRAVTINVDTFRRKLGIFRNWNLKVTVHKQYTISNARLVILTVTDNDCKLWAGVGGEGEAGKGQSTCNIVSETSAVAAPSMTDIS